MRHLIAGLLLAASLLPAPPSAAAGELAPVEQQIVHAVRAGLPDGLSLLETAVNQNSGTMNFDGVRAVADLFAPRFEALGFAVTWKPGEAWGRAGHLVAERRGAENALHVLFIGHLDTVFEPDSPFQTYQRLSETQASGPGVTDMKGGVVVMLLALGALQDAGILDQLTVSVVLTGDEEKSGKPLDLARADLTEAARKADIAIGFEDGDGNPATAVVSRRGYSSWMLTTRGKAAHSSQIFREDLGSGAIYEMARILHAFQEQLSGIAYLTANPGALLGGTEVVYDSEATRGNASGKTNVIAQTAVAHGDLRALTLPQREEAKALMLEIAAQNLPHTQSELVFTDGYPPLAPSEGNLELLSLFSQASMDLGHGPVEAVDPARAGAADISFTAGLVRMALDGVGLMGSGGHTVDEVADLTTLSIQAERMAVTLYRLSHR